MCLRPSLKTHRVVSETHMRLVVLDPRHAKYYIITLEWQDLESVIGFPGVM